jgi:hypothetical protein
MVGVEGVLATESETLRFYVACWRRKKTADVYRMASCSLRIPLCMIGFCWMDLDFRRPGLDWIVGTFQWIGLDSGCSLVGF